jgi:hypothetical protein
MIKPPILQYLSKFSVINYVKLFCLLSITLYAIYVFFTSAQTEVAIVYPDYIDAKIKPTKHTQIIEKSVHSSIISKNDNIYKHFSLHEPEQPINLNTVLTKQLDPIDKILAEITTDGTVYNDIVSTEVDTYTPRGVTITKLPQTNIKLGNIIKNSVMNKYRYNLQLAAVKSEAEGLIMWNKLEEQHSKILGNLTFSVTKNTSNQNKVYYVVTANGYNNLNQARSVCTKLLKTQQTCIVIDSLEHVK